MPSSPRPRRPVLIAIVVAAACYFTSFVYLMQLPGASLAEPLFLLAALGIAFPLLAWACTLKPRVSIAQVAHEQARVTPVLLYLAVFALFVLGWGFSALNETFTAEPSQSIAQLTLKLLTMVLLPAALFLGLRLHVKATLPRHRLLLAFLVMSLAYLALQAVFGRGLTSLRELGPSLQTLVWAIPLCWLWQSLEAGLCEEVLFRRILQERIANASGSHVFAITVASLLFGLAHAPGLWLRGGHLMEGVAHATPGWALAYSIVMIAPAGIVFGVLWARTRSLLLLVSLHGMVDLLPQLAPFIRAWTNQG